MTKSEIREKYLGLRSALSSMEVHKSSGEIARCFFSSVDISSVRVIHTFLPIVSKKEVDSWLIIDELRKDHPHIKISVPKVEGERLLNFYFENRNQLTENRWKILEPVSGEITPSNEIDLVLVPLLAFDKRGNRVGYGKGFYDKFLAECRRDCRKVGLSFFDAADDLISVDSLDIPLDAVVTPEQLFVFKH